MGIGALANLGISKGMLLAVSYLAFYCVPILMLPRLLNGLGSRWTRLKIAPQRL
jgi:hypothetical protein